MRGKHDIIKTMKTKPRKWWTAKQLASQLGVRWKDNPYKYNALQVYIGRLENEGFIQRASIPDSFTTWYGFKLCYAYRLNTDKPFKQIEDFKGFLIFQLSRAREIRKQRACRN